MFKLIILLLTYIISLAAGAWFDCESPATIKIPKLTDEQIKEALNACPKPRGDYLGTCTDCQVDCIKKRLKCRCNTNECRSGGCRKDETSVHLSSVCFYRNFIGVLRCGKEECPLSYVEI